MTLNRDSARVVLALATVVGLLAGCGSDSNDAASGNSDAAGAAGSIESPEVVDATADIDTARVVAATVRLRSSGCGPRTQLGTGTVIDDAVVVTAAHVVAGSDRVTVLGADGTESTAEVVLFDPDLDVAVLRLAASLEPVAPLRTAPPERGETGVVATVDPDGAIELLEVEVLRDVIVRTTDIYRASDVERPGVEIAGALEPGDSGAMVHLPGGGAGIVWSRSTTDPDRAWAVDLPDVVLRDEERRALSTPVDTGRCL